jgi:hypothetical protein
LVPFMVSLEGEALAGDESTAVPLLHLFHELPLVLDSAVRTDAIRRRRSESRGIHRVYPFVCAR